MDKMSLCSISPIDGRYKSYTYGLNNLFSEYAFIRQRIIIEIKYFIFILKLDTKEFPYNENLDTYLSFLSKNITDEHIFKIKEIEEKIHHDVKSIEYFLTEQLHNAGFEKYINLLHFGITSQDTNTMAYSISLLHFNEDIFFPLYDQLLNNIQLKMVEWKEIVILGRTHGQAATWTLLGKEFNVFRSKLVTEYDTLLKYKFTTKIGGTVGNITSHKILVEKDWEALLTTFAHQLRLKRTKNTTQIHNYNEYGYYFDILKRVCSILIDMCRDIWLYCSFGELILKKPKEYVGSSIMPHKVNPIEFENAEGNLKIAEMWLEFLSRELLKSRLQRDLTDSTILRNLGTVFGHILISFKNINRGFTFLKPNIAKIEGHLLENISSMSEVDQHLLRLKNKVVGYDTIKKANDVPQTKDKVEYYKQFILQ
tara:strand:+ start:526 stop:1797 length:1272 start_codon:yes stop_codon:yes gene_type:complete